MNDDPSNREEENEMTDQTTTEFACRYDDTDKLTVRRDNEDGRVRIEVEDGSDQYMAIYLSADDARSLADAIAPRPVSEAPPARGVDPARRDSDPITNSTMNGDNLREAARIIAEDFWWYGTVEGESFWDKLHTRLRELAEMADARAAEREARAKVGPFLAPCPTGFGTVLGHLAQQGKPTDDHGVAEGRRLAAIAARDGVAETWVRAPEVLRDVCDRVRAYPADFLARHLGPVPEGAVKMAA